MSIAMPLLKRYCDTKPEDFLLASIPWFPIFKVLMMRNSGSIYFHDFKASAGMNIFESHDLKRKSSPGIFFV